MNSYGQFTDVESKTILQGIKQVTLEEDNQIAVQCLKKLSVEEVASNRGFFKQFTKKNSRIQNP